MGVDKERLTPEEQEAEAADHENELAEERRKHAERRVNYTPDEAPSSAPVGVANENPPDEGTDSTDLKKDDDNA